MQTFSLGHANVMEPFFKESNARRESRTERRGYKFTPTDASLIDHLAALFGHSETEVVVQAVRALARRLPVLGEIHCGPLDALPESAIDEWVNVGDLLKPKEGDHLLRARGDSMIGDGIDEGDLILIRPQNSCDNNDIAAVIVEFPTGPRATLKRVQFSANSSIVHLLPMNPTHEVIEVDASKTPLRICGVKRGVIKGN